MVEFPGNAWIDQMYTTIQNVCYIHFCILYFILSLLQNAH